MIKVNLLLIILVLLLGCSKGITGYYKIGDGGKRVIEVIEFNGGYESIHSLTGRDELQHIIDNKYVVKTEYSSLDKFSSYIDFDIPYIMQTSDYCNKQNFNLTETSELVRLEKISKEQYDQLLSNLKKKSSD